VKNLKRGDMIEVCDASGMWKERIFLEEYESGSCDCVLFNYEGEFLRGEYFPVFNWGKNQCRQISKELNQSDEIKDIENRSDERIENLTITEVDGKPIPTPDPLQALKDQIVALLNGHDFESMDVFNKDPEKIFISITLKKEGKK